VPAITRHNSQLATKPLSGPAVVRAIARFEYRADFLQTDVQLDPTTLGATWAALGRNPLPFETNVPSVFAAGDVRVGWLKRVASAIGEGASAVRFIHTAIGVHP
jgi:thioredoxin reductase